MHLSDDSYGPLLRRTAPPATARALAAHLEEACEACEGWLAARREADGLDGLVDAALVACSPHAGAAASGDDLEFARIMARVRARPALVR
jgi:hypothetical protein